MVSLPSKWAKKYNLKKGDEIDILENEEKLIVSIDKEISKKEIQINITQLDIMLYRLIGAIYKSGYEQVKIIFEKPEHLETIYDVLRKTCIGFEITDQSKNYVIIKEISKPEHHEFDNILRRNFLFLLSVAKDSLESIKKQDYQELKNIILKDYNINKYSDFCRRILNKRSISEFSKNAPLYCIIEQLEKIADVYRDLCKYLSENKLSLEKETLDIYENINKFLEEFYNVFYKFDLKAIEGFGQKRKEILQILDNKLELKSHKDKHALSFLNNIFNMTFDLNGALMTYKL